MVRAIIGGGAAGLFTVLFLYIVGVAVIYSWNNGDYLWALLKLVAAPLTFLVFPWFSGMVDLLAAALFGLAVNRLAYYQRSPR